MPGLNDFTDWYELLEVSPKASRETIECVFAFRSDRCRNGPNKTMDTRGLAQLAKAHRILADAESRAEYDHEYAEHQKQLRELVQETTRISDDSADRQRLLSLFYAQRRRDRRQPGIGNSTVESLMSMQADLLDFHIWYFREKGWIEREESGLLAITALGVDQIETLLQSAESNPQSHGRAADREGTQPREPEPAGAF